MVSVIQGHFDPWHPRLLNKTEVQLDAILEAYSEQFPEKLKFERKKTRQPRERVQNLSLEWGRRLIGNAKSAFTKKVTFAIPDRFRRPNPATSAKRQANQQPPKPKQQSAVWKPAGKR